MRWISLTLAGILALAASSPAAEPQKKLPLSMLYVGNADTPRGKAYTDFLGKHFRRVLAAERKGFDPRRAADFDVVLLDWSQSDRNASPDERTVSPLGPKEAWHKPTVLLGSAGLLLASIWEIHGAIG
jgi:hypothetical protein